jgi:cytochrome c biogenesis protein CcmG/thiol:disulfide interchange protein DsbE
VKRLWAILPVAALLALIILFAHGLPRHQAEVVPMAMVGKAMPDLLLPPLAGGQATPFRFLAAGPTLINFYASWCAPCADEAPALMALKAEGVKIIGVAYKDTPDNTRAFLSRYGNPYESVVLDPDGLGAVEFGVTGAPETYAIDAAGVIRGKFAGAITPAAAEAMLQKASR